MIFTLLVSMSTIPAPWSAALVVMLLNNILKVLKPGKTFHLL